MFKNQSGFTLIEMMIVLLIISVLLIITVPNVTKHNSTINEKGCDAFIRMVEGQVQAYKMDTGSYPEQITDLSGANGYLTETTCPNGDELTISESGTVTH